ncbi:hypothetical protein AB0L83_21920 [Streptomyces sp. NPDC052071]|uniref:hypothetical protein n=1 Tax=unclassified Streptomyces TaxID=2593676 RepID=UPI0033DBB324
MASSTDTAVAHIVESFDALDAIDDPIERYKASRQAGVAADDRLRVVRQRIALELKSDGKTWREIGQIMDGVTAQRAEQISKGR